MNRVRGWLVRLARTFRRDRFERDLAEEMESHIQLHVDDAVRRGASPAEARREARMRLGGMAATMTAVRDQGSLRWLESTWHDVRFSLRTLRKTPGFAAIVILTFALGIGANTAIFGAVNTVLLRPLPYPAGDDLVMLWATDLQANGDIRPVAPADFADWRTATRSYESLAASDDAMYALTGDGEPENVIAYQFAPEMFRVLGLAPQLGRTFDASDGPRVVVLGHRIWDRRYRRDPSVIGRSITLDGERYRVVGVMPPEFRHPQQVQLWTPLALDPIEAIDRAQGRLRLVGRLRPGVDIDHARAELRSIAAGLAREHPATNRHRSADVQSLRERASGDIRPVLLVLLGAVGFVLLLTCSNIAGLTLARGAGRRREVAMRKALGAGRGRIVRQLLTESLLLAAIGGVAGLVLAWWGTALLVDLFPRTVSNLGIPVIEEIPIDGRVLAFTLAAAVAAGVLSGLLPALHTSRSDPGEILKDGGRSSAREGRLRPLLVGGQVGLALVLLAGAGVLIRSAAHQAGRLGFEPSNLLTARVTLAQTRYPDEAQRSRLLADVLARVRAIPGVEQAGAISTLPLSGWSAATTFFDPDQPGQEREALYLVVDPEYFATMRIPIVRGRGFGPDDRVGGPEVIVVDQRFVRDYLGDRDPIGMRLDFGTPGEPRMREIIGVVAEVQNLPPPDPPLPTVYMAFAQSGWPLWGFAVRVADSPYAVADAVKRAVWAMDKDQPVAYVMTMEAMVGEAMAAQRISLWLLTSFAALAVLLAAIGIYGVIAHTVAERRHEIGIRMALGAQRWHVARAILQRLAIIAGAGIAVGLPMAWAGGRLIRHVLHGIAPTDPWLLVATAAVLAMVSLLAAFLPLRRAMAIDPMIALRDQ